MTIKRFLIVKLKKAKTAKKARNKRILRLRMGLIRNPTTKE